MLCDNSDGDLIANIILSHAEVIVTHYDNSKDWVFEVFGSLLELKIDFLHTSLSVTHKFKLQ